MTSLRFPLKPRSASACAIGPRPHPDAALCSCTDGGRNQPDNECKQCDGTGWQLPRRTA